MTTTHGNTQTYLGMNFKIKNGMVHIEMEDYLKDCIHDFPEEINIAANLHLQKC